MLRQCLTIMRTTKLVELHQEEKGRLSNPAPFFYVWFWEHRKLKLDPETQKGSRAASLLFSKF